MDHTIFSERAPGSRSRSRSRTLAKAMRTMSPPRRHGYNYMRDTFHTTDNVFAPSVPPKGYRNDACGQVHVESLPSPWATVSAPVPVPAPTPKPRVTRNDEKLREQRTSVTARAGVRARIRADDKPKAGLFGFFNIMSTLFTAVLCIFLPESELARFVQLYVLFQIVKMVIGALA